MFRRVASILFISFCFLDYSSFYTTPYKFPKPMFFPAMPENHTNPVTQEGIHLGRFLFYDPILSKDQKISCATCHRQESAFADSPQQFSIGINDQIQERNTPPLFNLAWRSAFFWDGKSKTIEDQVFHPIRGSKEMGLNWKVAETRIRSSEMYKKMFVDAFDGIIDSVTISKAIAQFERTLISYNSKYDRVLRGDEYFTEDEREGFILMNDQTKGNCLHCHPTDASPIMTTSEFSNNGLDAFSTTEEFKDRGLGGISGKKSDIGKFKIPSLRNVALTAPYMHDGRFNTLEEVLEFYSGELHASPNFDTRFSSSIHRGGVNLSNTEQSKIITFLHTLTDSLFITNPEFSNPFREQNDESN